MLPDKIDHHEVNRLGRRYAETHRQPGRILGYLHKPSASANISESMQRFIGDGNPYGCWMFLADCFAKLYSTHEVVAVEMIRLFEESFNVSVQTVSLVHPADRIDKGLSLDKSPHPAYVANALRLIVDGFYIQDLRQKALAFKPDMFAGQQAVFDLSDAELALLTGTEYQGEPSCYARWVFLAQAYASLPAAHGEKSDAILNRFLQAFKSAIFTFAYSASDEKREPVYFSPQRISVALTAMVNQYFAGRYKRVIAEMLREQDARFISSLTVKKA